MEDEDGTCLLDVLCDPQALNDFLHGTNELQTEDLLITSSSGDASLFPEAPSPASLLGDGRDSPGTPPPGCVDLSFLEEALLSSPEGGEEPPQVAPGGPLEPGHQGENGGVEEQEEVGGVVEEEEEEVACDILQQSLQEADITEHTMAMEAGLALYPPAPLLSSPAGPFLPKASGLPRDTQAAVEPPQPSLLAVGPGCPSLKPAAPQLMGLLPGNVFPAPPQDGPFSLSPAQGSMILHKAVPSLPGRPLLASGLRAAAAAAPGIILQRAPFPIQPKLPISIQPRLVHISPKPPGQKPPAGLTFVPGAPSPSIVLSQSAGPKPAPAAPQQLPKPVSLQLLNQAGSFLLQPQGLFQGQNQFLLPAQAPVSISQPAGATRPLLATAPPGASVHTVAPSGGHLVEGSQILTVPQRQLNFSPVFTTPSGQLALRQATVLSGALQLQSAPPAVFQVPAQLARAYGPGGHGQRTLVHGPALGGHITLINSSGVLPPDLASISILNGSPVVQGLPFAPQARGGPQAGLADGQLSLQQASVVLLPDTVPEERGMEETFQQLPQPYGHILQHISMQRAPAGLQPPSPPIVTVLQAPAEHTLVPEPTAGLPKLLMPSANMTHVVEEVTHSLSQNQAFMQLQQQALTSPVPPSELLTESLPSPPANESQAQLQTHATIGQADPVAVMADQCAEAPPLPSDPERTQLLCPSPLLQDAGSPPSGPPVAPPGEEAGAQESETTVPPVAQACVCSSPSSQPRQALCVAACLSNGAEKPTVQQHTHSKPATALIMEVKGLAVDDHPSSPLVQGDETLDSPSYEGLASGPLHQSAQQTTTQLAGPLEVEERLTSTMKRHRFQQHLYVDHCAVQHPYTGSFSTLEEAVRALLPYHTSAGRTPTQEDFDLVDQEFHTVSGFLLKRTKDMVNKYRQLLIGEAQQESPSAEMVMLERLFLQAERYALAEDRRRIRRDPESLVTALDSSVSSPPAPYASGPSSSPSSPPTWTRLSDRPPGLKTYRSSSRGGLRLTIKQESGSRKVVHNSACELAHKRDHSGQLANGGGSQAPNGVPGWPQLATELSNGPVLVAAGVEAPQAQTAATANTTPPHPLSMPEPQAASSALFPRDVSPPTVKRHRLAEPTWPEQGSSPFPPAPQEDNLLSEHLQSAIDSILELQRLQGPNVAPARGPTGPSLDQAVTSMLGGHL